MSVGLLLSMLDCCATGAIVDETYVHANKLSDLVDRPLSSPAPDQCNGVCLRAPIALVVPKHAENNGK